MLLEMRDVTKSFGATRALDGVSLGVDSGEVARLDRRERRRQEHADEGPLRGASARLGLDEPGGRSPTRRAARAMRGRAALP